MSSKETVITTENESAVPVSSPFIAGLCRRKNKNHRLKVKCRNFSDRTYHQVGRRYRSRRSLGLIPEAGSHHTFVGKSRAIKETERESAWSGAAAMRGGLK